MLEWLAKYWFLIFFIGGMLVTWGAFSNRMSTTEAKVLILEKQVQDANNGLNDLKGGIIRIETSLEFIKEKLDAQ